MEYIKCISLLRFALEIFERILNSKKFVLWFSPALYHMGLQLRNGKEIENLHLEKS